MRHVERRPASLLRLGAALPLFALLASCADFKFSDIGQKGLFEKLSWPVQQDDDDAKKVGTNSAVVRRIQRGLAELGYRVGVADGIEGGRTRDAIRRYERSHGLRESGEATEKFLSHLRKTLERRKLAQANRKPAKKPTADPIGEKDTDVAAQRAAPLPMPVYEAGTVYVYQGGRVERIVGVGRGTIKWQRNDGTTFSAHRNFLLPWTYWETAGIRGKVSLVSRTSPLWPGTAGQKTTYTAKVTIVGRASRGVPRITKEDWTCKNQGRERIKIAAGTFNTIRFECVHVAEEKKRSTRRIWHYAPRFRHYVRFEERTMGESVTRPSTLLSIRPAASGWPPVMRAALGRRLIAALRDAPNGAKVRWKSSGVPTEVTLEMTSRFIDATRRKCRTFIQTWRRDNRSRSYPGVACRTRAGEWTVPGVAPGEAAYIAIASDKG